jgi:hypothetical protein
MRKRCPHCADRQRRRRRAQQGGAGRAARPRTDAEPQRQQVGRQQNRPHSRRRRLAAPCRSISIRKTVLSACPHGGSQRGSLQLPGAGAGGLLQRRLGAPGVERVVDHHAVLASISWSSAKFSDSPFEMASSPAASFANSGCPQSAARTIRASLARGTSLIWYLSMKASKLHCSPWWPSSTPARHTAWRRFQQRCASHRRPGRRETRGTRR